MFAVTASGLQFAADATKPIKVFIFAGQSNMVGSDAHAERIDEFPMFKGAAAPQTDVRFAALPSEDPNAPAAWGPLVPGDSFGPDWFPQGSPEARRNLYPKFIAFIRDAMEDLTRQGYNCTRKGVFRHTGENDTYFGPYFRNYAA